MNAKEYRVIIDQDIEHVLQTWAPEKLMRLYYLLHDSYGYRIDGIEQRTESLIQKHCQG